MSSGPAASDLTLGVADIFYSLQGESSFSGRPCVFIRLAECNLRCSYCDTPESWITGRRMGIGELLDALEKYPCKLVELTGGEPMLQDETIPLMSLLHEHGYQILLETNGSIFLEDVPAYVHKIVDVKCPGSGSSGTFQNWNLKFLSPHDELKFVLTHYLDYQFALRFIRDNGLEGIVIHFSPVTSVLPAETLAAWMLRDGVTARLQLQLHKILHLQ